MGTRHRQERNIARPEFAIVCPRFADVVDEETAPPATLRIGNHRNPARAPPDYTATALKTRLGVTNSSCAATIRISRDPLCSVRRKTP